MTLARKAPIKRGGPLPKVNAKRKTQRKAKQRKHYASAEYRTARKAAMARAGGRCEFIGEVAAGCEIVTALYTHIAFVRGKVFARCVETEHLEAHHLRYPKSRPLDASDLKILCKRHHHAEEAKHSTRSKRF